MKESFDILIVGAGASGLAAAISAKRTLPRLRVAMLERLPRISTPGRTATPTANLPIRCSRNTTSSGFCNFLKASGF